HVERAWIDSNKSHAVAAIIVAIESRKLNSKAEGRSIPTSCPAAIVAIDRDVPGKIADSDWHIPIHIYCTSPISSTCTVVGSNREDLASMTHITTPPISRVHAITAM